MVVVGTHARVVGSADINRGIRHGPAAEDRVELRVVVGGEPHVVVLQPRGASAHGEEQYEAGERRGRAPQRAQGLAAARIVDHVGVEVLGIGVGDDDVGVDALTVGEFHAGHARRVGDHPAHIGARAHDHATLLAPRNEGICQGGEPAAEVPGAEFLLDVGHGHERRRSLARIRSLVRRIAIEQRHLARIAQVFAAESAQAGEGCDRLHLARIGRQLDERPRTFERRLDEGAAGDAPHLRRARHESPPILRGRPAELLAHGAGDACGVGAGNLECAAVREAVGERRVEWLDVDRLLEGLAGLEEEIAIDGREGEQARPGVEDEAVALVASKFAAEARALLEQGDVVALDLEACGGGHAPHTASDHNDASHTASLGCGSWWAGHAACPPVSLSP